MTIRLLPLLPQLSPSRQTLGSCTMTVWLNADGVCSIVFLSSAHSFVALASPLICVRVLAGFGPIGITPRSEVAQLAADAVALCAGAVNPVVYIDVDSRGAVGGAKRRQKGPKTVADTCDNAVLELYFGPDNGVDPVKGWIGGVDLGIEEV